MIVPLKVSDAILLGGKPSKNCSNCMVNVWSSISQEWSVFWVWGTDLQIAFLVFHKHVSKLWLCYQQMYRKMKSFLVQLFPSFLICKFYHVTFSWILQNSYFQCLIRYNFLHLPIHFLLVVFAPMQDGFSNHKKVCCDQ